MLLEGLVFDGKKIVITRSDQREMPKPEAVMVPRAARKGGKVIPKPRAAKQDAELVKGNGNLGQDAFRDFVKRKAEGEAEVDGKRRKID